MTAVPDLYPELGRIRFRRDVVEQIGQPHSHGTEAFSTPVVQGQVGRVGLSSPTSAPAPVGHGAPMSPLCIPPPASCAFMGVECVCAPVFEASSSRMSPRGSALAEYGSSAGLA